MSPGPYANYLYSLQNPHSIQSPMVEETITQMESMTLYDTEDQVNTYNDEIAHMTNILLYFRLTPLELGLLSHHSWSNSHSSIQLRT